MCFLHLSWGSRFTAQAQQGDGGTFHNLPFGRDLGFSWWMGWMGRYFLFGGWLGLGFVMTTANGMSMVLSKWNITPGFKTTVPTIH